MIKLSPVNKKRWQRFKENRRGYWCLAIFIFITLIAMTSELFFNSEALMVSHNGKWSFPFIQKQFSNNDFGGQGKAEPDYLKLQQKFEKNR